MYKTQHMNDAFDDDLVDDISSEWRKVSKEPFDDKKKQAVLRRQQKIERFKQKTDFRRLLTEAE
jgi:hypothetical protein